MRAKPTQLALSIRERARLAAHLLDQRPEDVPAVERQEGKQVDDRSEREIRLQDARTRSPVVEVDRLAVVS